MSKILSTLQVDNLKSKNETSTDEKPLSRQECRNLIATIESQDNQIDKLTTMLSMCDPRDDYGEGLECQFCHAKTGERHKDDCIYKILTGS